MDDSNFTQEQLDRARAAIGSTQAGAVAAAGFGPQAQPGSGFPFEKAFADKHAANTSGMAQALGATPSPLMTQIINRERQQVQALMALHEEVCSLMFALVGETAGGDSRPVNTVEAVYKGDPPAIGALGELAVLGSEQDKIIQAIRQTMTGISGRTF